MDALDKMVNAGAATAEPKKRKGHGYECQKYLVRDPANAARFICGPCSYAVTAYLEP